MTAHGTRRDALVPVLATLVFGVGLVLATVAGRPVGSGTRPSPGIAEADYGRRLLRETSALIGPAQPDPGLRFTGTHMACASCHLGTGVEPGTLSLLAAAGNYPRFSGRDGGRRDLRDRINGCMQRSMNGRALPRDSAAMVAMEAYIIQLGTEYASMGATRRTPREQPAFVEPARAANPEAGRIVFERRCAICHGSDGAGLRAADAEGGYVFPPLWGQGSFNSGAGMARVLTAAAFIKARMPLGQADLTDEEAYDTAAYVNSHARPVMDGLERDYPDRTTKPVDCPYPPYADPFPQEQHRVGPFAPIRAYYAQAKGQPSR